jgi:Putative zinc-finger
MTPEDLPSLLSASPAESSGRGARCPDEHQIAAYVDGTVANAARGELEAHLADCSYCLTLVGLLSREREMPATEPVSYAGVGYADGPTRPEPRIGTRSAPRWAAAAVLVLAMAALVRITQPLGPTADPTDGLDAAPTTRSAAATSPGVTVLSPNPGADIDAAQLTVRWTPVPGTRYYDVRVVTDAGDVIAEEQVGGTEWRLSDPAVLQPGGEYFVHVDALIADDKKVSSEHVAFRVTD